jgi:hypothetical protein
MSPVTEEQCERRVTGLHDKMDTMLTLLSTHIGEHQGKAKARGSFRAWLGIVLTIVGMASGAVVYLVTSVL